jgi:hypothetical protein
MAIQFLNNLNINDNQLLNAKVQVASTAPTAAKGQIYLDSTTNVNTLKYHDGSQWIGLKQVNLNNSTFVSLANLSATGSNVISLEASLSATGTASSTTFLRGDNTWGTPIGALYTLPVAAGGSNSAVISLTEQTLSTQVVSDVTFNGTTNGIKITESTGNNGSITIGLQDSVTLVGTLTVQGTGQSSFSGQVTIPAVPIASTDAASKAYVDNAVTGALVFQGGYDAATNTPNLDSPPTGTIKKGFMWTVTVDGSFFSEQVRVGDSLIANKDTPTTLADWTTVQSNIDLATLTTVGLGNVNAGSGIGVAYSAGTATVTNTDKGSDQNIFKNIAVSGQSTVVADGNDDTLTLVAGNAIEITTNATTDTVTIASTYTPPTISYATTISATATVTHNLNTLDVMVQLYDTVTNDTVYADITRASVNTITVTFSAVPTNPIRVLVQK